MSININVLAGHAPAARPAPVTPICQLSVIVPIFNEEAVIAQFHARLIQVLASCPGVHEIIYVDDGSTDSSRQVLEGIRQACPQVGVARLSRNFGKERAMTAGLEMARGEAVIILDVDLQDPPELIPRMLDAWRTGADVVNMRRTGRDGETMVKKATAHFFYRIINRLSDVSIPSDVGDFRLFSRRAVDALNRLPESNRFMKGLFAWIGFSQVTLEYHRQARAAGDSKWPYWKLWNFALEGITSFSTAPLRIWTYVGLSGALAAAAYGIFLIISTVVHGRDVPGYASLMVAILFLGSLQLTALGMIGEYIGRNYIESKGRPRYIIRKIHGAGAVAPVRDAS